MIELFGITFWVPGLVFAGVCLLIAFIAHRVECNAGKVTEHFKHLG